MNELQDSEETDRAAPASLLKKYITLAPIRLEALDSAV